MNRLKGITLLELIITLAVFAISITSIGPGLFDILEDNRILNSTELLQTDLKLARQEAITRGSLVIICPIDNGDTSSCINTKSWNNGWMIFSDPDNNKMPESEADLIKVQDIQPPSITVTGNLGAGNYIRFRPDGSSHNLGNFAIATSRHSAQDSNRTLVFSRYRNSTMLYSRDYK